MNQNDVTNMGRIKSEALSKKEVMIKEGTGDLNKPEYKKNQDDIDRIDDFFKYMD
jgi:hypothetical protein